MGNDQPTGHDSLELNPGITSSGEHAWFANCECNVYFCNTTRTAAMMAWAVHAIQVVT